MDEVRANLLRAYRVKVQTHRSNVNINQLQKIKKAYIDELSITNEELVSINVY